MHTQLYGIEHLMTGIEFSGSGNLSFNRYSQTMVTVSSCQPFKSYWRVIDSVTGRVEVRKLESVYDPDYTIPTPWTTSCIQGITDHVQILR